MYQPGDTLLNKYRIDALIGAGAFAQVYRATHLTLHAPRALKVLRRDTAGLGSTVYDDFRARFKLEAQLGAALEACPHVITVYDAEQDGATLILVMELAAGKSLAERLAAYKEQGALMPVGEAVRLAREAATGLAALHELDAVHRDVKPSNLLFDAGGRLKVADLGLAQVPGGPSQRSLAGSAAVPHPGTPAYMSPEQRLTTDYLTPASDVYSLGLVLFEMLTGRAYKNLKPGTRVSAKRPDAPAWLDELVARMVSEEVGGRPWDGGEVAAELAAGELAEQKQQAAREASERGERAFYAGDYDRAITEFSQAIQLDPQQAEYWYSRGVSYACKGDYDRAIADYNKALELEPQRADYWFSRGVSYACKGDYDRAIADYSKALELEPRKAAYWQLRGVSYHQKGDYDRAIADYNKALELEPQQAAYWKSRGVSYDAKGDYDRAIADYSKALELEPQKAAYWWERGKSYHQKGNYDRAIADKNRAIELDPRNAAIWYSRSLSYRAKGDTARADADLAKAREFGYKD